MNIGFDYSGTMDTYPQGFTEIGKGIQALGGKVYIISAVGFGDLDFDQVIIKEFPWVDEVITFEAVNTPQQKLEICNKYGVTMFFDDRKEICDHLNLNGVVAFRVWRLGQEL
jgi:hypothetical protein